MWIILTKKPPTAPSPPKLSIHWATLWPMDNMKQSQEDKFWDTTYGDNFDGTEAQDQKQARKNFRRRAKEAQYFIDDTFFGREPNAFNSVRINYMGTDIRLWRYEFNILEPEKMHEYVLGKDGGDVSHEFIPNSEADAALLRSALETDLQGIYDAALIDGCNPEMAKAVAMGIPIDDGAVEFPPIGWYKVRYEYGIYFCDEWELVETPPPPEDEKQPIKIMGHFGYDLYEDEDDE